MPLKDETVITAEILLDLKCINFSPKKQFKLTSGKKSPIYCDCRRLISFPKEMKTITNLAVKKIKSLNNLKKISNIAGGESAGIPFATLIASKLNLPMTYIRKEKKKFGKNSQIEGVIRPKENVILVEDLMTDGGSKLRFFQALENAKCDTKALFVIFNYGIIEKNFIFKKKKISLISLTNWSAVLKVARKKNIINEKDIMIINDFLRSIGVKN
jgi:orotate phosphoribosyltransferase